MPKICLQHKVVCVTVWSISVAEARTLPSFGDGTPCGHGGGESRWP